MPETAADVPESTPRMNYDVIPASDPDPDSMLYIPVAPTDAHGTPIPAALADADGDYAALLKDDVIAVAQARNLSRPEADWLPTEGTKADLIAALVADDNTNKEN